MGVIRWLLILVASIFVISFGLENNDDVMVKYFTWQKEIPLFLLAIIAVFAGSVMAGLIALSDQIRLRSKLRKMSRQVDKLENEVKSLRNLPLDDETGTDLQTTVP